MQYKKLWIALGVVMLISFAVLGGVGYKAINSAPPIPSKVVTADGQVLFTGETIRNGQNVWQSTGGPGDRHHLGTRRLCRSRLERRLSASPIRDRAESLGARAGICELCRRSGGNTRRTARPPDRTHAPQYLRRGD